MINKIGFGGGCHWCTEAVFSALRGVHSVGQGWIASDGENENFSEGVLVDFDPEIISLEILVAIHLHTHSSTSEHSMRGKYRSAVYVFSETEVQPVSKIIASLQKDFDSTIVTKALIFKDFKLNREDSLNYYFNGPEKPFCENYINPKLKMLLQNFSNFMYLEKLTHLK